MVPATGFGPCNGSTPEEGTCLLQKVGLASNASTRWWRSSVAVAECVIYKIWFITSIDNFISVTLAAATLPLPTKQRNATFVPLSAVTGSIQVLHQARISGVAATSLSTPVGAAQETLMMTTFCGSRHFTSMLLLFLYLR